MASNSAKGARYKAKTKKWLLGRGYAVADLEKVHRIFGTPFSVKKDQFGADLLAVSADEVVFVQVKGAGAVSDKLLAGAREFQKHVFPPSAKRWVVGWKLRARQPVVLDAASGEFLP